jgi:hypothetical protein
MAWTQSERRVQVHEIGHGVIDFFTAGRVSDRLVTRLDGEFVGVSQPVGGGETYATMDRRERLESVAGFWGGWAAVHLAIRDGLLLAEPSGVENCPGDRGYLGAEGSNQWWVEHMSELAGDPDPIAFADEARELALSLLEPHIETVFALAEQMDGLGFLPSADLEAALR